MKAAYLRQPFAVMAVVSATAFALCLPPSQPTSAQGNNPTMTNVVPESAAVTMQAKIRAINPKTREITLAGRSGTTVTVEAGPGVRLDMLKVGDAVNAQYYRSVAFMVSQPGMTVPKDQITQVTARPATAPGGIGVRQTKISGLVVGIDQASHSIDVVDPTGGGVYTLDVTDPARQAAMTRLKVGDTITAVVSEALAVSIKPAPKRWF